MSITLDILGAKEVEKYVTREAASLKKLRDELEPPAALKKMFSTGDRAERDGCCNRSHFMRASLRYARYIQAQGASAARIREVLNEGAAAFEPAVSCLDYTPFHMTFAVHVSQAKKYESGEIEHDLNSVFLAPSKHLGPQYQNVKVKVPAQPAQIEMKEALLSALCAWDFKRAEAMAAAYKLRPAVKGSGPNLLGVLRETILGNTSAALAFLENIPDGYNPDFPPDRRELAEGVLRNDAALVRKGLKAVSTRCKTAWAMKTYCTPAKLRRFGSIENMLPEIRNHLLWHHWTLSEWAVAWMSLAWHRGMKDAFSDPSLFCEWVPWELCCPEPMAASSGAKATKAKKVTATRGKNALKTMLFAAVEADDAAGVNEAISNGADIEALDLNRHTPLLAAAHKGKARALEALIQSKANLKVFDLKKRTPISLAAEAGHAAVVRVLLAAGLPPHDADDWVPPLVHGCLMGHLDVVTALIGAGAEINSPGKRAVITPLGAAAGIGRLDIVSRLLEAGAQVNQPKQLVHPTMICAAGCGALDVLQRLIEAGGDVNVYAYGKEPETMPLHAACRKGWVEGTRLLLTAGAKVNAPDSLGYRPLHRATSWEIPATRVELARLLLSAGADINAQDEFGKTSLMHAIGLMDVFQFFLESRADLTLRNTDGQTVFDLAKNHAESLQLLNQYRK